jgi:hypothetical protein
MYKGSIHTAYVTILLLTSKVTALYTPIRHVPITWHISSRFCSYRGLHNIHTSCNIIHVLYTSDLFSPRGSFLRNLSTLYSLCLSVKLYIALYIVYFVGYCIITCHLIHENTTEKVLGFVKRLYICYTFSDEGCSVHTVSCQLLCAQKMPALGGR